MATVRQLKIVIDASAAEEGAKRVVQAEQAMERAKGGAAGKGGDAARACLRLVEIRRGFGNGDFE